MAKPKRICSVDGCNKPCFGHGWCNAHYKRWRRYGNPTAGNTPVGEPSRWIDRVALSFDGEDCLIWPFGKSPNGYATVHIGGQITYAHRRICEIVHGAPPTQNHEAAHDNNGSICVSRACVNPRHLRWATAAENQKDRVFHGTDLRGEDCPYAKLTTEQVNEIRTLAGKIPQRSLAERMGVSQSTISMIVNRKRWTSV